MDDCMNGICRQVAVFKLNPTPARDGLSSQAYRRCQIGSLAVRLSMPRMARLSSRDIRRVILLHRHCCGGVQLLFIHQPGGQSNRSSPFCPARLWLRSAPNPVAAGARRRTNAGALFSPVLSCLDSWNERPSSRLLLHSSPLRVPRHSRLFA